MTVKYYGVSTSYPRIVSAVVDRIHYWVWECLYSETETYSGVVGKRIFLTSFEAGDEVALRTSIEKLKTSQASFPFTAYNLGELAPVTDKRSHGQKSFTYYSPIHGSYISAQPSILEIPMVSFFNNPDDYWEAMSKLQTDEVNLTRLTVPLTLNGVLTSTTIDLDLEINKGSLAYAFEDYLRLGHIYNITHSAKVYFHNFVLDNPRLNLKLYPVEDIQVALKTLSSINRSLGTTIDISHVPDPPLVSSTTPSEAAVDVGRTTPIIINFSLPMNEESVENYLTTDPFISADLNWNLSGTILSIEPVITLNSGTLYTIMITNEATSAVSVPFEEDFELTFTTGES
jgi:hypothetical protein